MATRTRKEYKHELFLTFVEHVTTSKPRVPWWRRVLLRFDRLTKSGLVT
jgi:hypothetical protein